MYYIYKEKYVEETDGLNDKNTKKQTTQNQDSLMIMNMSLKKKKNKLIKSLTKNKHLNNQYKIIRKNLINLLIKNKQV